jgi:hypothetical protein
MVLLKHQNGEPLGCKDVVAPLVVVTGESVNASLDLDRETSCGNQHITEVRPNAAFGERILG